MLISIIYSTVPVLNKFQITTKMRQACLVCLAEKIFGLPGLAQL